MTKLLAEPFDLVDLDRVASTNDEAALRAEAGAPAWTVVRAITQTAGRGRRGKRFISPPGNSYTSFVLRPEAPTRCAGQIALVAGLATAEAIEAVAPAIPRPLCKWPNDVLSAGAKVAGILVEAVSTGDRIGHVIVGIGVNLVSHPEIEGLRTADLAGLGARGVDRDGFLAVLAPRLAQAVALWQSGGFAALHPAWIARAAGLGNPVRLDDGSRIVRGRLVDVDADGAVVIDDGGRSRHRLVSGSLFLEDAA